MHYRDKITNAIYLLLYLELLWICIIPKNIVVNSKYYMLIMMLGIIIGVLNALKIITRILLEGKDQNKHIDFHLKIIFCFYLFLSMKWS